MPPRISALVAIPSFARTNQAKTGTTAMSKTWPSSSMVRHRRHPIPEDQLLRQRRMLTARATTSTTVDTDTTDCSNIIIFVQRASGMTSVGLNAVALVNAR